MVKNLTKPYNQVLLDAACLLPSADAGVIAPLADGVLMIAWRGQTNQSALKIATKQLRDIKAKV